MYTLIAVFYVSLAGIMCMILLKGREHKTGHPTIVSRVGSGTDHIFHAIFSRVGRWISYANRRTLIVLGQLIAFHTLVHVRRVYVEVKHRTLQNPHGRKILDAVRGRGEVKKHGASLYLRRISSRGK
ncbi:MAG: hypothetical protein AAB381_03015 [Patescibacteria group bacterium]